VTSAEREPATSTVLVVEDNPITRKMVRVALECEGYVVVEFGSASEALDCIPTVRPDLLVLDYVLPDMNGLELLREIRSRLQSPQLPALIVTGMGSELPGFRGGDAHAQVVAKPLQPARLLDLVRTHLVTARGRGEGKSVLVIDDDPINLKLIVLRLTQEGYDVTPARGGAEGLLLASQARPDVILSDVLMPSMDGFAFCVEARRVSRLLGVPIVLASAVSIEEADQDLARKAGASALVIRTPDLQDVLGALERSLLSAVPQRPLIDRSEFALLHRERLQVQVDRQHILNEGLARQTAVQATALSVVRGLSEVIAQPHEVPRIISDVLVHCLDATGLSSGLLYMFEGGGPRLRAQFGIPAEQREEAEQAFGHLDLLRRVAGLEEPIAWTSRDEQDPEIRTFLERLHQSAALIVPFAVLGRPSGVFVLTSDSQDLAEGTWLAFGKSIAAQFGHSVALGHALTRLATAEARYRAYVEQANDALLVLELDGRVREVNGQAEVLLGRSRDRLVGASHLSLVAPQDRGRAAAAVETLRPSGPGLVECWAYLRGEGARVDVEASLRVVHVEAPAEEHVVLAILRNAVRPGRVNSPLESLRA
jgi:PAS domain S-box-containing protein